MRDLFAGGEGRMGIAVHGDQGVGWLGCGGLANELNCGVHHSASPVVN